MIINSTIIKTSFFSLLFQYIRATQIIGRYFISYSKSISQILCLVFNTLYNILICYFDWQEMFRMLIFVIFGSALLVAFTTTFSGIMTVLHATETWPTLSDTSIAMLIKLSIIQELGPIISSICVSNRCCSYIAAKIASMKASEQLNILQVFRISIYYTIFVPMIVACTIGAPILVLVSYVFGSGGGIFIALTHSNISYAVITNLLEIITFKNILFGLIKGLIFGFCIGCVGCYHGAKYQANSQGVGTAVTKAVVGSFFVLFITDFLITWCQTII